jgi:hypothetical protein
MYLEVYPLICMNIRVMAPALQHLPTAGSQVRAGQLEARTHVLDHGGLNVESEETPFGAWDMSMKVFWAW